MAAQRLQQPAAELPRALSYDDIRQARIVLGEQTLQGMESELVSRYYGLVLAEQASKVRTQVAEAMKKHLFDSEKLAEQGQIALCQAVEYGGNAMTFRPGGDPAGGPDGFPGSLFVTGHDRMPYGEVPDGSRVAEISIPAPVASRDVSALPVARHPPSGLRSRGARLRVRL